MNELAKMLRGQADHFLANPGHSETGYQHARLWDAVATLAEHLARLEAEAAAKGKP